ncbi:hypothetical protein BH23THE1_BH23THE1_22530 [soil metagenome]
MKLINSLASIVIISGFLILGFINTVNGYHAEYHEGPSCGECHCSSGQDCSLDVVSGACDCTTLKVQNHN